MCFSISLTSCARVNLVYGFVLLYVSQAALGCAVGPDYKQPSITTPQHWQQLDSEPSSLTRASATSDLSRWWRRFNDPLLSTLVEQALLQNLDLRQTRALLREARARRAIAGAQYFPSLQASGSATRQYSSVAKSGATSGATDQFSAGFDAAWELDLFGGLRRSAEAAEADQEAALARLADARVSLAAEVGRNYFEVRALQIRLAIARENLTSQTQTLELTEFRAKAELVSSQDVEQARTNRETTLANIPTLEVSVGEAEHRLDVLLGRPPGTLHASLNTAGELPVVPFQVAVGIPANTLRQRADVRAAEYRLWAETARVGVAEAARYPALRLSGSIGLEALSQSAVGTNGGIFYSLLGGITAPLFNAGRLRKQVEVRDAIREQALAAYEKAVLIALQDVENALLNVARSRQRAEALTRADTAARAAAQLARQRYGAGLIDFQSVLDTERTVLSVQDSLASTRGNGVLTLIQLYKALGGGWSPTLNKEDL